MTTQYLLANQSTFRSLQSFNSLDELNESIKYAFKNFSNYMTPTTKKILGLLSKYSVKYLGVSMLAKSTIADELNVDIRTVRRSFRQLEELGLIKSYRLKRTSGDRRESSSAVVLTKLVSINVLPVVLANKQDISLKDKDIKDTRVTEAPAQKVDKEAFIKDSLLSKIPVPLRVLGYFFNAQDVYKHVSTIYKAKSAIDRTITIEEHSEAFESTIKQVVSSFKLGKLRNFDGVLYAAIKSLCKSIQLKSQLNSAFGF